MFDGGGLALAAVVAALFPSVSAVPRSDPPPCGGLLQPQCPPPQQPPPQQSDPTPPGMATVTMHTSATDVGLAKPRVVLTGQITGAAGPRPRLVLRAESVAYSQAFPNVDGRSDASGHFRFAVRPQVNTTYRVATADGEQVAGQSPPVDVRVYPMISISFNNRMPRSFRALLTVSGPEVLNVETGPVRARAGSARYG
jgi:hypothetical protein